MDKETAQKLGEELRSYLVSKFKERMAQLGISRYALNKNNREILSSDTTNRIFGGKGFNVDSLACYLKALKLEIKVFPKDEPDN